MPISKREMVLAQVSHSMHSLLCTTTNETPRQKQFFEFRDVQFLKYQSSPGLAFPELYMYASTLAKLHEPLVEKNDLIHATSQYARVCFGSKREANVSLKYVAPITDDHLDQHFLIWGKFPRFSW